MTNCGLLLSTAAFDSLTLSAQNEVLSALGLGGVGQGGDAVASSKPAPVLVSSQMPYHQRIPLSGGA